MLRLLSSVFLVLALGAQDTRPVATSDPVAELVAAQVERQQLVGLSLAWIAGGEVGAIRSFGFADRERRVPASERTLYRWASISKPVTAVAALQLWEKKQLDLDQDVRSYVPEFPTKPWPISARQLLAHQGGVVHYSNGVVRRRERAYDTANPFADVVNAIDTFCESPLVCEPGTRHSYTTHGYILLGAVVQRAGGSPYWEQVRARIAEPLGMKTFQPDYQWVAIDERAVGYRRNGRGDVERSTDTDVSWKLPGGGFLSSVGDLARFGAALVRGELVESKTRDLMWTRQQTKDGKETGYGLGFAVRERDGQLEVAHSGAQEKTATLLVLRPGTRSGIALMCNTEGARLQVLAEGLLALGGGR
jgi:CubicO group peptidase (beta-lactamase class C family)